MQVVFLRTERAPEQHPSRRLTGVEALRRSDLVYRWRLGLALGCQALMFKAMVRLIEAVPVVEVARSEDLADLPELIDRVRVLGEMPRG